MSTKVHTNGNGHPAASHPAKEAADTPPISTKTPKTAPASATSATPSIPASIAPTLTAADVTEMLDQLDAMAIKFGAGAAPLTIEERRRLLKIRPGGATHATSVMKIADRYGLSIPGVKSTEVTSDTELVQNLAELITRFNSMLGLASDLSSSAESRIWRAATTTYTTLARLVPQYPSLQRELTPMASFLAIKYKDAPTSLRKQEKGALTRTRKTRKEKEAAAAQATPSAPAAPVALTESTPGPAPVEAAPTVVAPAAPAAVAETPPQVSAVTTKTPAASS